MSTRTIRNAIDHAYSENIAEMREAINAALADKITDALSEKKKNLAGSLFESEEYLAEAFPFNPKITAHWHPDVSKPREHRDGLHSSNHVSAIMQYLEKNGLESHPDGVEAAKAIINHCTGTLNDEGGLNDDGCKDKVGRKAAFKTAVKHGLQPKMPDFAKPITRAPKIDAETGETKTDKGGKRAADDVGPLHVRFRAQLNSALDDERRPDGKALIKLESGESVLAHKDHISAILDAIDSVKDPDRKIKFLNRAAEDSDGFNEVKTKALARGEKQGGVREGFEESYSSLGENRIRSAARDILSRM